VPFIGLNKELERTTLISGIVTPNELTNVVAEFYDSGSKSPFFKNSSHQEACSKSLSKEPSRSRLRVKKSPAKSMTRRDSEGAQDL
jgi:RNA recognition motif-containing protein